MKGDLEILNYALTLEYLEADFYAQVIDSGLAKGDIAELAKAIGQTEQDHVDALTKTIMSLGGKPATKPKTKFEPVLDKGLDAVLQTAATVENLGAAAYLGQAPQIKNKEILAAALSIHSVEARHAAGLNMLVGRGFTGKSALEGSIPDGAFGAPMDDGRRPRRRQALHRVRSRHDHESLSSNQIQVTRHHPLGLPGPRRAGRRRGLRHGAVSPFVSRALAQGGDVDILNSR